MTALHLIPTDKVRDAWKYGEKFVQRLCERTKLYEPQHIREICASDGMQLWFVVDGEEVLATAITWLVQFPLAKVCYCVVAGEHMDRWLHLLSEIEDWARSAGCRELVLDRARKGWARKIPDYDLTGIVLEKSL